jgi:hypothetical protein
MALRRLSLLGIATSVKYASLMVLSSLNMSGLLSIVRSVIIDPS